MPSQYRQLKPRPGHSGKAVAQHQRGRILTATIELVDGEGYDALSVAAIVRTAGISKHTFYENFADKEDCFLATYEVIVRHTAREILAARKRERDSCAGIRAGFHTFSREIADQPKAARLALIAVLGAGPGATKARLRTHGLFETLIADSLAELGDGVALPPPVLRGVVVGISQIARVRLLRSEERELPDEVDDLMDWVLSLRHEAAYEVWSKGTGAGAASRQDQTGAPNSPTSVRHLEPGDERGMILSAVARLAAKDGYQGLTVTRICAAAGVPHRRFIEHFSGVEDCFLAALEMRTESALKQARSTYRKTEDWPLGVHRTISWLCSALAQDRTLVRMGFVEVMVAGAETLPWRVTFLSTVTSLLRRAAPAEQRPGDLAAEASIAAVLGLMHSFATAGRARRLPMIAGMLSYLVLAPAIGPEAAASVILQDR